MMYLVSLLFIIYINDIYNLYINYIDTNLILYADDINYNK